MRAFKIKTPGEFQIGGYVIQTATVATFESKTLRNGVEVTYKRTTPLPLVFELDFEDEALALADIGAYGPALVELVEIVDEPETT